MGVAPIVFLAFMVLAVYFQVTHYPFSNFDDPEYVQANPRIQHGITWATLRWAITSTDHANWHPVTWLSHALDCQLFGLNASGHHATSLMLHLANTVLLFLFLARVTGATGRSFLVAALFAVHPLNVESVAWVAERKNLLCMFFFLLTLFAYSRYARDPRVVRYLLVAATFLLSLASKPMAVTIPLVLLLVDIWPLQRVRGWSEPSPAFPVQQFPFWTLVFEKLPLLTLSAGSCVITILAQYYAQAFAAASPVSGRVANAIVSYAIYLEKAVWPVHLAALYPFPTIPLLSGQVFGSALLILAITGWVWHERSRQYLISGWFWFLGTMVPVIGLVQVGVQGMADRYAYLPLVGIFIMVVWRLADLVKETGDKLKRPAMVFATVMLALFSMVAWRQARFWRSNYDLWSHTVSVTQNNWVAEDALGSEILARDINSGRHYSEEAQMHFQKALRINPADNEAMLNIGGDLEAHGKVQEAMEKFQQALQETRAECKDNSQSCFPGFAATALTDLGEAYERLGDFATARRYYLDAMKTSPGDSSRAFVGFARLRSEEEIQKLVKTLAMHSTAQGFWQLGQLREGMGDEDAARAAYEHALQLDPGFEPARQALQHEPSHTEQSTTTPQVLR